MLAVPGLQVLESHVLGMQMVWLAQAALSLVFENMPLEHGEQVAAVRVGSPAANPCPMGHVPHVYSLVLTCEYTALKTTLLFQASTIRRLLHEVREVADLKMSSMSTTVATFQLSKPVPLNLAAFWNVVDIDLTLATFHNVRLAFI
jgi:hypothetical protein